jgi:hypothetical protein
MIGARYFASDGTMLISAGLVNTMNIEQLAGDFDLKKTEKHRFLGC